MFGELYFVDKNINVYIIVYMQTTKRELIHIRLDKKTHSKLKKYAKKDHRNISDTVRMLIDSYIIEKEKNLKGDL
ncbi:CopG-like domain-containing protein DNA-binding protein [Flexistipes sinusarabici DSM 4947]|uniref:CopG-like domain-containing protein DNA-binding protein n=2 Tax=Flexistipes sinusarabici TaxID=2352 RepID=F8E6J9_FLESM|nr:CopG-like domain-containing protein DNA-binding protein [Flexistipes sinusarabici DSM 4947]